MSTLEKECRHFDAEPGYDGYSGRPNKKNSKKVALGIPRNWWNGAGGSNEKYRWQSNKSNPPMPSGLFEAVLRAALSFLY